MLPHRPVGCRSTVTTDGLCVPSDKTTCRVRWERHEGECNAIKEIYARNMAGESMEKIYNDFRARD